MGFFMAAWIVILFATGGMVATRGNPWVWGLVCAIVFVGGFGYLFQAMVDPNKKGPCAQYETQMHYNAATKTMRPARVCVLRGEWVEEVK